MEDDARDFATDEHYCEHGTYIGTWCGPDYMCGWCEAGIGADEARQIILDRRRREAHETIDRIERMFASIAEVMANKPYDSRLATNLTGFVWDDRRSNQAWEALCMT